MILLVLAVALDSITFAAVWPQQEANPIVLALGAPLSLALRWGGVLLLVAVSPYLRHARRWFLLGASGGVVGAASNVWAAWL